MDFEAVIGLETHIELSTVTKMFCGCSTVFGHPPNTQVCPVCLALPGSLPLINRKAVEYTIKVALALNCQIQSFCQFHRKNYFYPDLPKGYQISQYDLPLGRNGYLEINTEDGTRKVRIHRVHMEEDTGKLIHSGLTGRISEAQESAVDFNRCGVPLLEIVTEPDLRTPEEAKIFLSSLRNLLQYLEVSDCNMEEGSLRCDANISVRRGDMDELGTKTEVKNLNSFRFLSRALQYEIERQKKILAKGGVIRQETRHFDATTNRTTSLRSKEMAHDYRYFPEPDLVPLEISDQWVDEGRRSLPELPGAKRLRFMEGYGLPEYDAEALTSSRAMADFFEECAKRYHRPKIISNWLMGDFTSLLNATDTAVERSKVTPEHLTEMLKLIDEGVISGKIAKSVFEEMFNTGRMPREVVEEKGLTQIADEEELARLVAEVIAENEKATGDYREGKGSALGFLVGQVMKKTRGRANPELINRLLRERLGGS
ncbi:aspartyl-tRNA(Asn)/glutamyl-tRNA(Gln) amidotransferase subunit B [Candidatus Hakubella thermalkaliphila]|uniref:Aspartyl/glutamyl-tRNA(Asn/Gln) amidotransferase subunit B n=2 Tax=Candidatus Hakubella thermalkaliphila TaxID=2754717 RepID=A0A6V8PVF3_9ACTN|nr:Asp-tRNA(Asn)/Glu-tRNA(Gln) amidotransferase subunit GatB [Candidatus Hakubella thermalkaliphila]GFP18810.1 aspartyl-tRNA(Asn)/glutamyl-tRNA(Gln) amidotransferase subunit B [Candidatus Hakubella thermalkaliphila]GFP29675.1 aspartyl-tRNA(Asn)/glutamyl-tRNA(Gln) amidotransferase subunit B [Candidatus Hakubella thermalkaliphila]GFP36378.1 aspartyl-tRNA(Asn)/glutamyl-tRNA(Gln) amidotransferase subunit B [Candidatus Hakubella thermalkaliphila]GFP43364.1 aspartyl-tRNA(Asn)/glutamyl-tRNA(Gln) amido